MTVEIIPVHGLPEVRPGADLSALVAGAAGLRDGDVLVVTHKIVSKSEGRIVALSGVEPSPFARQFAAEHGKDPRQTEVVLRESRRIVKMDRGVLITETHHGFVCANAGVDASNVPGEDEVCLLPLDPDASAARLHAALRDRLGITVPVVVSDSFGRPWREGITNVALGVAGMRPLADYRGQTDPHGYPLEASILAVADELASAAELVVGKTSAVPLAIVRNYGYEPGGGSGAELVMSPDKDLFR
ncbi:coenzyme F420-0:L-glutamate ligase [Rubrobacter aplysinae]|uniref:coenzyme F420-0:L-glutamate ligase n=1 Tax=Rubrobacter aplysinae TaxID=909625 RepID=UPI00064C49F2|nr:coenzyme F420-0:L-glutamate ligase [Rubrobacter aplysinae]